MKRILFLLLIILPFISEGAKKVKGFYISRATGDTIQVTFKIRMKGFSGEPDYEKLQWKVRYYGPDNKIIKLKPIDVKEINFVYELNRTKMISHLNTLKLTGSIFIDNRYVLLKLEKEGALRLYKFYKTQSTGGGMMMGAGGAMMMMPMYTYQTENCIFQKKGGELFRTKSFRFKKSMAEYVKEDCPALAEKIENKVYKSKDIESIVDYYNSRCTPVTE